MRANGLTYEEIGKRLQMNHATVANLHKAYRLFPNHRDTLPISCYIAIARADTVEPPEEWAAFAEENHLSVRALQEALKMPLQAAKEKYGKQEKPSEVHLQEPFPGVKDAQQKIASLYTTIYGLQQDVKGLSTLVNSLRKEKAVLQEDLRKQHAKAVSLLKEAHVREKALLSLLKAVAEEAGVPARWKRAADVFADDANKLVKAVRGIKKLNAVYLTMLKNKNVKKAAKKGA
jgi:transcriptional regulator with XRE-family HTH domain